MKKRSEGGEKGVGDVNFPPPRLRTCKAFDQQWAVEMCFSRFWRRRCCKQKAWSVGSICKGGSKLLLSLLSAGDTSQSYCVCLFLAGICAKWYNAWLDRKRAEGALYAIQFFVRWPTLLFVRGRVYLPSNAPCRFTMSSNVGDFSMPRSFHM